MALFNRPPTEFNVASAWLSLLTFLPARQRLTHLSFHAICVINPNEEI